MRVTLFASVFLFAWPFLPASAAPPMNNELYELGSKICADIANGDLPLPASRAYIDTVDAAGAERAEFCHCVGEEFGTNEAQFARMQAAEGDDASAAIVEITLANMALCLPGARVFPDLMPEKDDVWQCRQAMDGSLTLPGFNLATAKIRARMGGKDVDDICGCAGGFLALMSDHITQPQGMDEPNAGYKMQLATGITQCLPPL